MVLGGTIAFGFGEHELPNPRAVAMHWSKVKYEQSKPQPPPMFAHHGADCGGIARAGAGTASIIKAAIPDAASAAPSA